MKRHGRLEDMPEEVAAKLPGNYGEIRRIYLEPEVTDDYRIEWGPLREDELYAFLCDERSFSRRRVDVVVDRMRQFHRQKSIREWLTGTR